MRTELVAISTEDAETLKMAHHLLQNPGLVAKLSNLIGEPIEAGLKSLPESVTKVITAAVEKAIHAALHVALKTMDYETPENNGEPKEPNWLQRAASKASSVVGGAFGSETAAAPDDIASPPKASNFWHKAASAASGAVGGAFGLPAIAIELPISTTIMMRSIADIARSEGENLSEKEAQLECVTVLGLGGTSKKDDGADVGYFAVRQAMASAVTDAAAFLAKGNTDTAAPALVQLIKQITQRFGVVVGDKAAAQLVPIIGAASGAAINTLFMNHFQDMAHGHFTVRRLQRKYGDSFIRAEFEKLTLLAKAPEQPLELPASA